MNKHKEVEKMDKEIARMAIGLWTVERTLGINWTAKGAILYTRRKEALSAAIFARQRLAVSPEFAAEAFN